jgi:hypothetical protein
MKTRGRRHNSGSKRRHTRKHYMRGGAVQQQENQFCDVMKVYDDANNKKVYYVVPEVLNVDLTKFSDDLSNEKLSDKTSKAWAAFTSFFNKKIGSADLNSTINDICEKPNMAEVAGVVNPNPDTSSSASVTTTTSEQPLIDLSESSETSSTTEPETQVNPDLQGLSFGGKRRIRRY